MKKTRTNFTTVKMILLAVLTSLVLTASAQAATYTVDRTDDATVQTCTAAANDCTLRGAIEAANATAADDIINFDATIFNVARTITLSGTQLTLNNNGTLTINGTGANLLTVSGNNTSRVFIVNTGTNAVINGLTISNGSADNGGGIQNFGTLTLNSLSVDQNTVSTTGGGITSEGTLVINNSTVSGNTAQFVGGLVNYSGTTTINNSTVSGNSATIQDGGIYNFTTLNLNSSTVSNNSSNQSRNWERRYGKFEQYDYCQQHRRRRL